MRAWEKEKSNVNGVEKKRKMERRRELWMKLKQVVREVMLNLQLYL